MIPTLTPILREVHTSGAERVEAIASNTATKEQKTQHQRNVEAVERSPDHCANCGQEVGSCNLRPHHDGNLFCEECHQSSAEQVATSQALAKEYCDRFGPYLGVVLLEQAAIVLRAQRRANFAEAEAIRMAMTYLTHQTGVSE